MNSNSQTAIQLQRLIDGEMTPDELRAIARQAEESPELWRMIGINLIEDRFWQHQLAVLPVSAVSSVKAANTGATQAMIKGQTAVDLTGQTEMASSSLPVSAKRSANRSAKWSPLDRSQLRWIGLAASMMLMLLIGYSMGNRDQLTPVADDWNAANEFGFESPRELPFATDHFAAAPSASGIRPASLEPDYHLNLPASSQSALEGSVPLYSLESIGQMENAQLFPKNTTLIRLGSAEQLKERGFWIKEDVRLISGNLDDGRMFLVPIRTVQLYPTQ